MRKIFVLVLAGLVAFPGCGGPQPPPFKPIADTKLLMQAVIDPAADVVWESVGTIISAAGTQEIVPKNAEEWTAVRNSAVALTESGNLLMMVPRAKDDGEWMKISQAMIDAGAAAMRAAEARNAGQLFTIGGDIYDVCTACHSKYMPAITQAGK